MSIMCYSASPNLKREFSY